MYFVLNRGAGCFSLSAQACEALKCEPYAYTPYDLRSDPNLIKIVQTLGKEANGSEASLRIYEIPDVATDWKVIGFDDVEDLIYVDRGRIFYAHEVDLNSDEWG